MSIWKNYECEGQISIFQKQKFKIKKPIRLIELFAGVGSQAMALRDIGANFEHYRSVYGTYDEYGNVFDVLKITDKLKAGGKNE